MSRKDAVKLKIAPKKLVPLEKLIIIWYLVFGFFNKKMFCFSQWKSAWIWGIFYFGTMDGLFRILEKSSLQLICTWLYLSTIVLHMCFDRFLLACESRDLSQADKSIKRVFSFPNWVMSSKSSFSVSQAWGLNFLKTKFCQSSQIYLSPEKTEKTVYFSSLQTFEW